MYKIVTLGEPRCGKSILALRTLTQAPWNDTLLPTLGFDLIRRPYAKGNLIVFDFSGDEDHHKYKYDYVATCDLVLLCVDLSAPCDLNNLKKTIRHVKEKSSQAKIILAGTKADVSTKNDIIGFNNIDNENIDAQIICSAKTTQGLKELNTLIFYYLTGHLSDSKSKNLDDIWFNAKLQFLDAVNQLPKYKQSALKKELNHLSTELATGSENRADLINQFTTNCHNILKTRRSASCHIAIKMAASIAILLISTALGFGLGLVFGLCAGPGALIPALLTGSVAIICLLAICSSLALSLGAMLCYHFFKTPTEARAVNHLAEVAQEENADYNAI